MNAPITPADRAAAEKALRDLWFECGKKPRDPNGGVDVIAAAIADARKADTGEQLRFALMLAQDEIRVALSSRKRGMTQKELYYWDGRQEAAQRMETMLMEAIAARRSR